MSKTLNKVISTIKNWTARIKAFGSTLWRRTPLTLRYAGLYLLAMVIISSLMFWRFNPARYSYNPDPGGTVTIPGDEDPTPPEDEGSEDEDINEEDLENQARVVFNPARGDKLFMPLAEGRFLDSDKYIYYQTDSVIGHRFLMGVHISGVEDADVFAVWSGTVTAVKEGLIGPEIIIENGAWRFIHRGLKTVLLSPGDKVQAGQKIGTLAKSESGGYSSSFLELSVQRNEIYLDEEDLIVLLEGPDSRP